MEPGQVYEGRQALGWLSALLQTNPSWMLRKCQAQCGMLLHVGILLSLKHLHSAESKPVSPPNGPCYFRVVIREENWTYLKCVWWGRGGREDKICLSQSTRRSGVQCRSIHNSVKTVYLLSITGFSPLISIQVHTQVI